MKAFVEALGDLGRELQGLDLDPDAETAAMGREPDGPGDLELAAADFGDKGRQFCAVEDDVGVKATCLPALANINEPSISIAARDLAASSSPLTTGKERPAPLSLAGVVALSLTPFCFKVARKDFEKVKRGGAGAERVGRKTD